MPKRYPSEFRDDVVRVARKRESGVTIEHIPKDFGVHPMTLQKWLQRDAVDDGARPGQTRAERAELRETRKRIRLLEQDNEAPGGRRHICRRRTCREKVLPAREGARRLGDSRDSDVPGSQARPPARPTTGGRCLRSPIARWWRRIGRTRYSTRIQMTRSLGIGPWPMRLAMRVSRWRTAPRGGSRRPTGGAVRSGRSERATARSRDPPSMTTIAPLPMRTVASGTSSPQTARISSA